MKIAPSLRASQRRMALSPILASALTMTAAFFMDLAHRNYVRACLWSLFAIACGDADILGLAGLRRG